MRTTEMSEKPSEKERILILCIDNDNDLGSKTGLDTPVIGRQANLDAATRLAIMDPEEADANAIFAAVKIMDSYGQGSEFSEETEVATITGLESGGVGSDRKLVDELGEVLSKFSAKGVVLVSDGYSDQSVVPIIQSRIPIVSIRHVVVKHSERLEETWAVLLRYGRMVMNDPKYSRFTLGVPGLILVVFGMLWVFNQLQTAGMALLFILGIAFLVRGFGIDDKVERWKPTTIEDQLKLTARVIGIVFIIIGGYLGGTFANAFVPADPPYPWENLWFWFGILPLLIGHFLQRALDVLVIGAAVGFVGEGIAYFMKRDSKVWRSIVALFLAFWLRFILEESATFLIQPQKTVTLNSPLVILTTACIISTATLIVIISRASKRYAHLFGPRSRG